MQVHLPKRKIKEAYDACGRPKMKAKPEGTSLYPREVASRGWYAREEAQSARSEPAGWSEDIDDPSLPWDARGPPGPMHGGPTTWRGQKYRRNSCRWANAGGRHRDKFSLYYKKKKEGLRGTELAYWHPYTEDGHWAQEAKSRNALTPLQEKLILADDSLAWLNWDD